MDFLNLLELPPWNIFGGVAKTTGTYVFSVLEAGSQMGASVSDYGEGYSWLVEGGP